MQGRKDPGIVDIGVSKKYTTQVHGWYFVQVAQREGAVDASQGVSRKELKDGYVSLARQRDGMCWHVSTHLLLLRAKCRVECRSQLPLHDRVLGYMPSEVANVVMQRAGVLYGFARHSEL